MRRMTIWMLLGTLVMCTGAGASEAATLRLGTLAPKNGPWGKILSTWAEALRKRSNGDLDVDLQWNATAGSERTMIGKIRTGELAGAAVTAEGLSAVHKPMSVLRMPGAFDSWSALDTARELLRADFDRALRTAGFERLGWADVGAARMFSKGVSIATPGDLRGHTTLQFENDVIGAKLNEVTGVGVRVGTLIDVLPMLENRSLDVLTVPPLIVSELRWASYLDHVNDLVVQYESGAILMGQRALDRLTAGERSVVLETGARASAVLVENTRKEDDAAHVRLVRRLAVESPNVAQRRAWERAWKQACVRATEAIPGDVLRRIGHC